jgi:glycine C-acetyltransferase
VNIFNESLRDELDSLRERNLYMKKRILQGEQSHRIKMDGREVIMLCANNYLGLATNPKVKKAAKEAIDKYGVGLGCGRVVASMDLQEELESRLAKFKRTESAIVFQTGYDTNLATLCTLLSEGDVLISDELNHASIVDGSRIARYLNKAVVKVYPHKDMEALARLLEDSKGARRIMVATDGVFSMDGDIAPLPEIVELAEEYSAITYVDDSHACGVIPPENGRGTVEHFGLHGRVDIQMGTLSKAFPAMGGYIAGSTVLTEYLWQRARPFIFATGHMPPPVVAALIEMIDVIEKEPQILRRLWENTRYFKEGLKDMGYNTGESQTPITPVIVGESKLAQQLSEMLLAEGVFAQAFTYPIVAEEKARLRTQVSALHSRSELSYALKLFEKIGKKLGIISSQTR